MTEIIKDDAQRSGHELITTERLRQQDDEGFSAARDDKYSTGELVEAAIAYATGESDWWPWKVDHFKYVDDEIRNLVKAGALIAAEIDRLKRERV